MEVVPTQQWNHRYRHDPRNGQWFRSQAQCDPIQSYWCCYLGSIQPIELTCLPQSGCGCIQTWARRSRPSSWCKNGTHGDGSILQSIQFRQPMGMEGAKTWRLIWSLELWCRHQGQKALLGRNWLPDPFHSILGHHQEERWLHLCSSWWWVQETPR